MKEGEECSLRKEGGHLLSAVFEIVTAAIYEAFTMDHTLL